jgi:mono/diheme cytochrome c family protein
MRPSIFGATLLIVLAGMLHAQSSRTVWNGVYSKEQAKRGQRLYAQECATCHGPAMEGIGEAPPLAGEAFAANWNGRSLGELFERMRTSMPGDDPGKLDAQQNADLLACMLATGKFPAGRLDLPRDVEELNDIIFLSSRR